MRHRQEPNGMETTKRTTVYGLSYYQLLRFFYQKIKLLSHIPILKMDSQWFTRIYSKQHWKILKVKTRRRNGVKAAMTHPTATWSRKGEAYSQFTNLQSLRDHC